MSILRSKAFLFYGLGLCAIVGGAAWAESSGSMLPLAMASALALMTMVGLVHEIRARRGRQSRPDRH